MDTTINLNPNQNLALTTKRRSKRPRVRFMTPNQLAPYKEEVWKINETLVDWSRAEFDVAFYNTELYAVFLCDGVVVGVATVMEKTFILDRKKIFTIGLGRAVVKHEYRNQFLVQRALIFRWIRKFLRAPLQPIYIWGSCVSYKSYLSFVKVLKVVYPVTGITTPTKHEKVIDFIGSHWYGQCYIAEKKVVRVPNFKISDESVVPKPEDLDDASIRFYCQTVPSESNATYGLLTVSPCIRSNFLPMVGSWLRNFVRKAFRIAKKQR